MKLNFRSLLSFVIFMAMALSGCALPHPYRELFTISRPDNGTVYEIGRDIIVEFRTTSNIPADPNRINFEVQIFDNGSLSLDHIYDPSLTIASLTLHHPAPGGHILSAQARSIERDGTTSYWFYSKYVCTYVGDVTSGNDFCSFSRYDTGFYHTTTGQSGQPLEAPTLTPTPTPIPVIDSVQGYPNPIYYGNTCPAISTVNFRAALTLPNGLTPDLVTVQAHVSVNISSDGSSSGSLLVPLTSNGSWDATSGGQVFTGTLALNHSYNDANNHFDPAALGGSSGALLWYVDVSSHDATLSTENFLGRSANQVINLAPCPVSSIPQHNSNKSGSPATGCSQYTNQVSCNLGGCSWNPQNSSCTVNP